MSLMMRYHHHFFVGKNEEPPSLLHSEGDESNSNNEEDDVRKEPSSEDEPVDCCVGCEACGTVHNVEGFTPREVDKAKAARKLHHDLGAPGYPEFKLLLSTNGICDCPVSVHDVKLAEKIFGPDASVLKGKRTKPHPPIVGKENLIELPDEMQLKETEVALDVVYVEDQAFVNAVDRKAKYKSLA